MIDQYFSRFFYLRNFLQNFLLELNTWNNIFHLNNREILLRWLVAFSVILLVRVYFSSIRIFLLLQTISKLFALKSRNSVYLVWISLSNLYCFLFFSFIYLNSYWTNFLRLLFPIISNFTAFRNDFYSDISRNLRKFFHIFLVFF